jgi:radical SAM protein with 4Fe4S-binding SPASM domain
MNCIRWQAGEMIDMDNIQELKRRFLELPVSDSVKSIGKLTYRSLKNPSKIERHLNNYRCERNIFKATKIDYIPPIFNVTIAENCNLRCPSCLYLLDDPDRFYSSFIGVEEFREMLELYNHDRKFDIIFMTGGEVTLHPDLKDLIDICWEYHAKPRVSSNGILVKNKIDSLLRLDYINISVDSYDYASFKKHRGGSPRQFDMIKEGLEVLKEHKMNFSMSFVLSQNNVPEVFKMLEYAREITPPLVHFHNINPHGNDKYAPLSVDDKETMAIIGKLMERTDYSFDIQLPPIFDFKSPTFFKGKCPQPWNGLFINTKGDVSYCCHMIHDSKIGNVFKGYDLNSEKMMKFRQNIIEKESGGACFKCQRRFAGEEFARFSAKARKWFMRKGIDG